MRGCGKRCVGVLVLGWECEGGGMWTWRMWVGVGMGMGVCFGFHYVNWYFVVVLHIGL